MRRLLRGIRAVARSRYERLERGDVVTIEPDSVALLHDQTNGSRRLAQEKDLTGLFRVETDGRTPMIRRLGRGNEVIPQIHRSRLRKVVDVDND